MVWAVLLDSDTAARMRMLLGTPKPSADALNHTHLVKGSVCVHIDRTMTTICGKTAAAGTPHGWLCSTHANEQGKYIINRLITKDTPHAQAP